MICNKCNKKDYDINNIYYRLQHKMGLCGRCIKCYSFNHSVKDCKEKYKPNGHLINHNCVIGNNACDWRETKCEYHERLYLEKDEANRICRMNNFLKQYDQLKKIQNRLEFLKNEEKILNNEYID